VSEEPAGGPQDGRSAPSLVELTMMRDLARRRLVPAREIGQVRDAIDHTGSVSAPSELENYPTVRAAVAALREG
jgi:hypothetical protein